MSRWAGTEDCLAGVVGCDPATVLDAGSGSGLWGCLLRHYLDVEPGRMRPEQWRTRIDAIEVDPSRIQQYARGVYTEILIGDVREVLFRRVQEVRYDVVLLIDVIEDLYKDDGLALLETAAGRVGRRVLVRVRLGDDWYRSPDPATPTHLSCWSPKDFADRRFAGRPCRVQTYDADRCALVTIGAPG